MLDRSARPVVGSVLTAPAARLSGVPPVVITMLGLAFGLAAVAAAAAAWWGAATIAWLANRLLDGLDGTMARLHRRHSDRGAFADMMSDVLIYGLLPIGIAIGSGEDRAPLFAALLIASCYLNITSVLYLSALLEKRQTGVAGRRDLTSITLPPGLIEGTETVLFYTLMLLFPGAVLWLMGAMAVAVAVTAGLRFWRGWLTLEPV